MKKYTTYLIIGGFVILVSGILIGAGLQSSSLFDENLTPLSETESTDLIFLREEEKLARDVYLSLFDIWENAVFSNIAKSEQTHTDAVLDILVIYGIPDPVQDDSRGVFENDVIQGLYDGLMENGSISLIDALLVGTFIEEIDIIDLLNFKANSSHDDVTAMLNNLLKGSENHLRSFVGTLEALGVTYEPLYLSQEYYTEIITSPNAKGPQ